MHGLGEHYWYTDEERVFILGSNKDRNPEYILSIWLLIVKIGIDPA